MGILSQANAFMDKVSASLKRGGNKWEQTSGFCIHTPTTSINDQVQGKNTLEEREGCLEEKTTSNNEIYRFITFI